MPRCLYFLPVLDINNQQNQEGCNKKGFKRKERTLRTGRSSAPSSPTSEGLAMAKKEQQGK
jgi:hypothetical protein